MYIQTKFNLNIIAWVCKFYLSHTDCKHNKANHITEKDWNWDDLEILELIMMAGSLKDWDHISIHSDVMLTTSLIMQTTQTQVFLNPYESNYLLFNTFQDMMRNINQY